MFEVLSVIPPANFSIDRGCGMNDRASEWDFAGGVASSQVSCEQAWLLITLSTETDRLPLRVRIHSLAIHYTINVASSHESIAGKILLFILDV